MLTRLRRTEDDASCCRRRPVRRVRRAAQGELLIALQRRMRQLAVFFKLTGFSNITHPYGP
jgi:hypothetical protein